MQSPLAGMPVLAHRLRGSRGAVFDEAGSNIHTLITDGESVWAGFSCNPSLLYRIDSVHLGVGGEAIRA